MLIVGSRALKHHYPDLNREPKDWDYIGTKNEIIQWFKDRDLYPDRLRFNGVEVYSCIFEWEHHEFEVAGNNNSSYDYLIESNNIPGSMIHASPEILLSLKNSCLDIPTEQEKHVRDYYFLVSKISDEDKLSTITEKRLKENTIIWNI